MPEYMNTGLTKLVGDQRYAPSRIPASTPQAAETGPRSGIQGFNAVTAGVVFFQRITLQAGAYTTVTVGVGTQGVTLTNSFFGLYDVTSLARLALSADVSTPLAAVSAGTTGSFTLNYTVPAQGDYYLAILVGSAGTAVQLASIATGIQSCAGITLLEDRLFGVHNATGQTALPDPIVLSHNASGIRWYWMRYA